MEQPEGAQNLGSVEAAAGDGQGAVAFVIFQHLISGLAMDQICKAVGPVLGDPAPMLVPGGDFQIQVAPSAS